MRSPFTSSLTAKPDQLLHSFDHSSTSATFADQLLQRSVHVPKTLHLPCSSAFPPIKFRPVRARLTPFKTSRHLVLSARFRYPFRTRFITALSHRTSPFISTKSMVSGAGQAVRLHPTSTVQYFSCLFDDRFSREDQASRRTRRTTEFSFIPASSRFELDPLGYQVSSSFVCSTCSSCLPC